MALTDQEYTDKGGLVCPYCGSTDIEAERFEGEALEVWSRVECNDCHRKWFDVYTMTRYEPIVDEA